MLRFPTVREYVESLKANPAEFISALILGLLIGWAATAYLSSLRRDWRLEEIENDRAQLKAASVSLAQQLEKSGHDLATLHNQLVQTKDDSAKQQWELTSKIAQAKAVHDSDAATLTQLRDDLAKLKQQATAIPKPVARPSTLSQAQKQELQNLDLSESAMRVFLCLYRNGESYKSEMPSGLHMNAGQVDYELDQLTKRESVTTSFPDTANTTPKGRAFIAEHGFASQ
jgi:septal ring factor EnvC (AmiA/AmiB activator)